MSIAIATGIIFKAARGENNQAWTVKEFVPGALVQYQYLLETTTP